VEHEHAWQRLPDLLADRDEPELLRHVGGCHACQQQLFRLARVDRLLREAARRRGRARRLVRAGTALVAVGAAVAALAVALPRHGRSGSGFVLRTASGFVLAHATLAPADRANVAVSLVAHGLPGRGHAMYTLWTRAGGGARPVLVGRFMTDRTGSCRARFNLPRNRSWTRFWVTRAEWPRDVVATT
jgi:hypothetical protein